MKENEQIANIMGWELNDIKDAVLADVGGDIQIRFPLSWIETCISVSKLLQQRMSKDGWKIRIIQSAENDFMADTWEIKNGGRYETISTSFETEPATIVELFKKVYKIKVKNERNKKGQKSKKGKS